MQYIYSELYKYHRYLILEDFITLKRNPLAVTPHPSPLQPLATTSLLSISMDLPIGTFHINGVTLYEAFWAWLILLSIFPSFTHVPWSSASDLFVAK